MLWGICPLSRLRWEQLVELALAEWVVCAGRGRVTRPKSYLESFDYYDTLTINLVVLVSLAESFD